MAEEINYLTAEGKAELEKELQEMKDVRFPELGRRLKEAVEMGDLKENADYHDTKEKMGVMQGEIYRLEAILRTAVIIENDGSTDEVRIGSTVTIRDIETKEEERYTIVGPAEANPSVGRISQKSPIGAALLGRRKKEKVKVETPGGTIAFQIMNIE
jgi:transcription elongation factor GreA